MGTGRAKVLADFPLDFVHESHGLVADLERLFHRTEHHPILFEVHNITMRLTLCLREGAAPNNPMTTTGKSGKKKFLHKAKKIFGTR
jgi:hypothetical protein